MESFEINNSNEFVKNSDGPINIDGMLSDAEKREFQEAFLCDCGEIKDETNGKLAELLHTDVIPYIEDSELPEDTQAKLRALAEKHPHNQVDLGITIPGELEKTLSQGGLDLSLTRAISDIEIYISEELQLPGDSNISSEEYAEILSHLGYLIQGQLDGIDIVVQEKIEEYPDLSLSEMKWIINSTISEYFNKIRTELITPVKGLLRYSSKQVREDHLYPSLKGDVSRRVDWDRANGKSEEECQKLEEILLQSEIDTFDEKYRYMLTNLLGKNDMSDISEDYGFLFMGQEYADIQYTANEYQEVNEKLDISLLNEEDRKIERDAMLWFMGGIAGHIAIEGGPALLASVIPGAGTSAGAIFGNFLGAGIDIADTFSDKEAILELLKQAGVVPQEYYMEKTLIDNILAGLGLIPGITIAVKSKKLASLMRKFGFTGDEVLESMREVAPVLKGNRRVSTGVAPNEVLIANGKLGDTERIEKAEELLGITLTQKQQEILLKAHNAPQGNNVQKGKILMGEGGFDRDQAQILMDQGIAGIFDTISQTRRKLDDIQIGYPELTTQFANIFAMLGKDEKIVAIVNNGFRDKVLEITLENFDNILSQNSDLLGTLKIKKVVSNNPRYNSFSSDKLPENWLQEYQKGINQGIQNQIDELEIGPEDYEDFEINLDAFQQNSIDVVVHFSSGDIAVFSGTPEMIMRLTEDSSISSITKGFHGMDSWVDPLYMYDKSNGIISKDELLDGLSNRIPDKARYFSNESDLVDMPFYHGTVSTMVDSVRAGARNVGKGFGGKGLYIATGEDRHIAEAYANMARHGQSARQQQAGIQSQEQGFEVILQGKINPGKSLRVGVFTIVRDGKIDLENGILPAFWANDPRLQELMIREFDVLDIRGARSAGMNLDTDRILVFHESAGEDAIIWE